MDSINIYVYPTWQKREILFHAVLDWVLRVQEKLGYFSPVNFHKMFPTLVSWMRSQEETLRLVSNVKTEWEVGDAVDYCVGNWVRCRETRCRLGSQVWKCGCGALWAASRGAYRSAPLCPMHSECYGHSEPASDSLTSWKGCRSGRWLSPAGVLSGRGWGLLRKSSWTIAPRVSPVVFWVGRDFLPTG